MTRTGGILSRRRFEESLPRRCWCAGPEAMRIGKDAGSPVGEYPESGVFQGAVERVILFNGERPAEVISKQQTPPRGADGVCH